MKYYVINLIRILNSFWTSSIAMEMEYRFNLIIEILSVFGNLTGGLFTLSLFYNMESDLGGWSWESSIIVLGVYTLLEGFTITFLQPNLSRIVRHVQNGTLDFVLLKPIDSQLWVSFRIFSPWGIPSIIAGLVLILSGLYLLNIQITFTMILRSISMLISSLIILYSLWYLIATTSIWFVRVWNANEVLRSTLVAGKYPVNSYPDPIRTIFTFVIPIAFLTTVPAESMLSISSNSYILTSILISSLFFLLTKMFWNYALRFYTSASS